MDKKQAAEQFRTIATAMKVMAFSSKGHELKEHLIVWTLIPTLFFILFRTYATPIFGWWLPQIVGGFLFSWNWYADQEKTGNFVWYKRIAHLAIAYIFASTYNLKPLDFQ